MNSISLFFAASLLLDGTVLFLSFRIHRFSFRTLAPPTCLTLAAVFLLLFPRPVPLSGVTLLLLFPAASWILSEEEARRFPAVVLMYLPSIIIFSVFFFPAVGAMILFPAFLLILSRVLSALRRLQNIPASAQNVTYYCFAFFSARSLEEALWFFCALTALVGGTIPAFALALAGNLYLVFRVSYGSPFFFSPALDGKIFTAAKSVSDPTGRGEGTGEAGRLLYERCRKYMQEKKPFLVESFCLRDLASALATNTGYLSRVINRETGLNFRRFVNGYRVKYSMDLFRRSPGISVNDLASLSGFATSSTYYTSFQQFCHESPGSWCRRERRRLLGEK